LQIRRIPGIHDEQRTGQRRYRHGAHIDPVRGRQVVGRKAEKRIAVEDQRHQPYIQHASPQPHGQGQEIQLQPVRLLAGGGQQRAGHGNGLRRHDRQQPAAIDAAVQRRFVGLDSEHGENVVDQGDPQKQGQHPQQLAGMGIAVQQHVLASQYGAGCDRREEARAPQVIGHVAEKRLRMTQRPQHAKRPYRREQDVVQIEQHPGHGLMAQVVGRNGNDSGGHDHAEIGGRHGREPFGHGGGRAGPGGLFVVGGGCRHEREKNRCD